jgi:outer membrane protein TolC
MKRWTAIVVLFSGAAIAQDSKRLTLDSAISLALKQNRQLELARLQVVGEEHQKEIARSKYFPQIRNESAVLHITELAGVSIPQGALGNGTPTRNVIVGQGGTTSYTSGTGLAQPLTQLLKVREANRAATADVANASIQLESARDEIALKVRQLYGAILIAQWKQNATELQVKAAEAKEQETKDEVAKGQALEVSSLESRAGVLEAKQDALTQRLALEDARIQLDYLLGLPLTAALSLDETSALAVVDVPARGEALRLAVTQSPEIRSAQQQIEKARAGVAAARDSYIPDITGLARYSYQSGVPLLVHNFGSFGFSLTWDLFDGGKREAELGHAKTLLRQAEVNLARLTEEVLVKVNTAYDQVEQIEGLTALADEVLKVRTEAARVSSKQVELQAALPSQLSRSQAQLLTAQANAMEASVALTLAQGDIRRILGLPQIKDK